jgi:hypothetical protein
MSQHHPLNCRPSSLVEVGSTLKIVRGYKYLDLEHLYIEFVFPLVLVLVLLTTYPVTG